MNFQLKKSLNTQVRIVRSGAGHNLLLLGLPAPPGDGDGDGDGGGDGDGDGDGVLNNLTS